MSPSNRKMVLRGLGYVVAGAGGLFSAFAIALAKFATLSPIAISHFYDPIVSFGASGSMLLWPVIDMIGLGAFTGPVVVGLGILVGVRWPYWMRCLYSAGIAGAVLLTCYLVASSIALHVLGYSWVVVWTCVAVLSIATWAMAPWRPSRSIAAPVSTNENPQSERSIESSEA